MVAQHNMHSISNKLYAGALVCAVVIFCAVSYSELTTWPKFWYDEGIAVEIAHTFAEHQILDITVAPHVYSPYAAMIAGPNGYPVTIPLALAFDVFGFSLFVARFYMLLWCIAFIAIVFFFLRKFFDTKSAVLGCLLMLSFASFFANGRTVTGEIPGFSFLLLGIWLLLEDKFFFAGLLLGLAAASKPSLYLWVCIPAAVDVLFFRKEKRLMNLVRLGIGYVLPILLWLYLIIPRPVTFGVFASLVNLYKNPFNSTSILGNVTANLMHLPLQSTILYFFFLICISAGGFYITKREGLLEQRIFLFFSILGVFSFIYFLHSPGWLRYLVPLELSTLILVPVFFKKISLHFSGRELYATLCIAILVGLQAYVLFFNSHVYRSDTAEQTASYLNTRLGSAMVGIIDDPTIAALVPADNKYHYITSMTGVPVHGVNALSLPSSELPKFMVVDENNISFTKTYASVLDTYYRPIVSGDVSSLFERVQ